VNNGSWGIYCISSVYIYYKYTVYYIYYKYIYIISDKLSWKFEIPINLRLFSAWNLLYLSLAGYFARGEPKRGPKPRDSQCPRMVSR
jgi:hypothetical protein